MSNHSLSIQVPVPDAESLELVVPGGENFDTVVERRQKARGEIVELETIIAQCNHVLGITFSLNKLKAVVWRKDWEVILCEPANPKGVIDAAKLIDFGVEPAIIQAATVYGEKGKPYIRVQKIGKRG